MDCTEFQRSLTPFIDGELSTEDKAVLEAHVTDCAACRADLAREQEFRDTIRGLLASSPVVAPASLKARINRDLAWSRGRRRLAWAAVSAAAASVAVLAVSASWSVWQRHQRRAVIEDVVARHLRSFPLELQHASPAQIEAWFGNTLDRRIVVPHLPNATAQGARLLNVRDKQAAYIVYNAAVGQGPELTRVGLFVYGDDGDEDEFAQSPAPQIGSSHGLHVATWKDGTRVYHLVGDVDEPELRELMPQGEMPRPRQRLEVTPASFQR